MARPQPPVRTRRQRLAVVGVVAVFALLSLSLLSGVGPATPQDPRSTQATAECACAEVRRAGPASLIAADALAGEASLPSKAIATSIATDTYVPGVLVLYESFLRLYGPGVSPPPAPPLAFLVLVTDGVDRVFVDQMRGLGMLVIAVADWDPGTPDYKSRWQGSFSKMHLIALEAFQQILFIDPDQVLTDRVDDLLNTPNDGLQSRVLRKGVVMMDAGIFLVRPSRQDICGLLCQHNTWSTPEDFAWGEQPLLYSYYSSRDRFHELPIRYGKCTKRNPVLRDAVDVPRLRDVLQSEQCVQLHYFGRKPWEPRWFRPFFDNNDARVLTDYWWSFATAETLAFPYASVYLAAVSSTDLAAWLPLPLLLVCATCGLMYRLRHQLASLVATGILRWHSYRRSRGGYRSVVD